MVRALLGESFNNEIRLPAPTGESSYWMSALTYTGQVPLSSDKNHWLVWTIKALQLNAAHTGWQCVKRT
jgi:hypothetical protein